MKLKRFFALTTTSLFLGLIFATAIAYSKHDSTLLTTPLATLSRVLGTTSNTPQNKIIFGFLPYWQFKERSSIRYDLLTHIGIFGLSFDKRGNIDKFQDDYQDPGWTALNSTTFNHIRREARAAGTKVILVLRVFDADTIDSITESDTYTQNLIDQTLEFIDTKNLDGVNIDFEYAPESTAYSANNFTEFTAKLTKAVKEKNKGLHVSVDVFADSGEGHRIWQIKELSEIVDDIIVMAYDYHRASSGTAGSVAPLYGKGKLWSRDVTSSIAKMTKTALPQKIILGVPYYGYEWQTVSPNLLSNTYPDSGATATYKRVQEIIKNEDPELNWDEDSLTPWLSYKIGGATKQIHYEDTRSLGLKYDFVNQAGLNGIGIWALGYDTGHSALWELIEEKFF